MAKQHIVALLYDFDKTLCTRDMQEYTFIPNLGLEADEFWDEAEKVATKEKMDSILAYMYCMIDQANKAGSPLTRDMLVECGKHIEYHPGVVDWFERINEYGRQAGVKVEHYIVSSGLKEIIDGTVIAKYFKRIFASEFMYNDEGNVQRHRVGQRRRHGVDDAAVVFQNDGGAYDDYRVQGEQNGAHAPLFDLPVDQIGRQIRAAGGESPGKHDAGTCAHHGTAAEGAEQRILRCGRQKLKQIGKDGRGKHTNDRAGHASPSAHADVQQKQRNVEKQNTHTNRHLSQCVDGN